MNEKLKVDVDSCFLRDHLWKHKGWFGEEVPPPRCNGLPYHPCGKYPFFVRKKK